MDLQHEDLSEILCRVLALYNFLLILPGINNCASNIKRNPIIFKVGFLFFAR